MAAGGILKEQLLVVEEFTVGKRARNRSVAMSARTARMNVALVSSGRSRSVMIATRMPNWRSSMGIWIAASSSTRLSERRSSVIRGPSVFCRSSWS